MKVLTVLCNLVLFVFTCLVLATDPAPTGPAYIVFTLLLLLIPLLTVFALARSRAGTDASSVQANGRGRTAMERAAGLSNVVLLGFVCWAIIDQYPHPEEDGVVAFTVLAVLTPILSAAVLFGRTRQPAPRPGA